MNAHLFAFSGYDPRGKHKMPAAALLLFALAVAAFGMLLLSAWVASATRMRELDVQAVLVPAGSMSTDEPMFSNSPRRDNFSLGARSSGESKVSSLTSSGRSRIKLDFIPLDERSERSRRGFPSVTTPAGAYGVESHGSPDSVFCRTGEPMNAKELARWIVNDSRFRPGMPVYLMACETGKGSRPFAQKLADALGTEVVAPTEKLWPLQNGLYIVAEERTKKSLGMFNVGVQRADITRLGEMKSFQPSKNADPMVAEARIPTRDYSSPDFSSSSAAASDRAQKSPTKKPLLRPSARTAALLAGIKDRGDSTLYLNESGTNGGKR